MRYNNKYILKVNNEYGKMMKLKITIMKILSRIGDKYTQSKKNMISLNT